MNRFMGHHLAQTGWLNIGDHQRGFHTTSANSGPPHCTKKISEEMNPIRWLLNLSAAAARKRGGGGVDPLAFAYAPVDSRDYEEWTEVDDAAFFNGNRKAVDLWSEFSTDRSRYARVTAAQDGSCRLEVYERRDSTWADWGGPSVVASLDEAQVLARELMKPF